MTRIKDSIEDTFPACVIEAARAMISDTEINYTFVGGYLILRQWEDEGEYELTFMKADVVGRTATYKV